MSRLTYHMSSHKSSNSQLINLNLAYTWLSISSKDAVFELVQSTQSWKLTVGPLQVPTLTATEQDSVLNRALNLRVIMKTVKS